MGCGTISIPLHNFTTAFNESTEAMDTITTSSIDDDWKNIEDEPDNIISNSNDDNKYRIAQAHTLSSHNRPKQSQTHSPVQSNHQDQPQTTTLSLVKVNKPCHFPLDLKTVKTMSAYHAVEACRDKKPWGLQKISSPADISKIPHQ